MMWTQNRKHAADRCNCGWLKRDNYGSTQVTKQFNPARCAEVRRTSWTVTEKTWNGKVKGKY